MHNGLYAEVINVMWNPVIGSYTDLSGSGGMRICRRGDTTMTAIVNASFSQGLLPES